MKRALVVAFLVLACALAGNARADGDPASDYLLSQKTFIPYDAKIPAEQARALNGIVADAKRKGYTIRVAVISRPSRLTVSVSPTPTPMPRANSASNEISGGPW